MFKSDLFFKDRSNVECDDILYQNKFTAILTLTKKTPKTCRNRETDTVHNTGTTLFQDDITLYEFLVILNQNRKFQTNLCTVFQKHFDYFIYTIVLVFDLNDDILMNRFFYINMGLRPFESQM